jgi:hypothetical protein
VAERSYDEADETGEVESVEKTRRVGGGGK